MNRSARFFLLVLVAFVSSAAVAESVDWNGPSGSRITGIRYPSPAATAEVRSAASADISSNVIDAPPVDGFVPWIVLTATDMALDAESTGVYEAFPSSYIGSPPSGTDPRTDYFIGLFDTGASAHVIGHANAVRAGLFTSAYLTDNFVAVTGVTGSLDTYVSWPYALFMAGLDALEPNAPGEPDHLVLASTAGLVGEYNVSTLIGPTPAGNPDLVTAIGTPMSVFYDARIEVDRPVTVTVDGIEYSAPAITFYEKDAAAPGYPNYIPLELKPAGAMNVQYITYGFDPEDLMDMFNDPFGFEMDYSPETPSVVMGNSSQSLFFVHSVDLADGGRRADNRDRFMLDTGAQITVIGSRIAARLGLRPADRDFEVDIQGVTGESIMAPGFYLDSLTIPAVGDWLEFTHVPVVMLDVFSPEGGTLDGIIGMNLFMQYNLMLRSGGFMLEDDPRLEFQRVAMTPQAGDIAPATGDYKVDLQDVSVFSSAWLSEPSSANWNPDADLAPVPGDELVGLPDLMVIADNWLAGVAF